MTPQICILILLLVSNKLVYQEKGKKGEQTWNLYENLGLVLLLSYIIIAYQKLFVTVHGLVNVLTK